MGRKKGRDERGGRKPTAQSLLMGSSLLHEPFRHGLRMPVSTEPLAERFVWQAWILPDPDRPGDPQITFELHHMELTQPGSLLDRLDEPFKSFLETGSIDFGPANGIKTFIDASSSEMAKHIPVTFLLQPLWRVDDIDKPKQLRRRIETVEEGRYHSPNRVTLRWSDMQKALDQEAPHVVPFRGNIETARWYQALAREDGKELVVARLPDAQNEKLFGTQPDQMFVNRRHYLDEGGAIVRISPRVVQNLIDVIPIMVEDLDLLARELYTRPAPTPFDPFAKAESMFEELLCELRFAKETRTMNKDELQATLIESGTELLEELKRVVLDREHDTEEDS